MAFGTSESSKRPPALAVASLANAGDVALRLGAAFMVSLVDPGLQPERPETVAERNHLILHLDDVEGPPGSPPAPEHVKALMAFYRHWAGRGPMVVHCVAGVSRSSAAAFILASAHLPGYEQAIAGYMKAQPYMTHPNQRLVALGDAHLGRQGKMKAAVEGWLSGLAPPMAHTAGGVRDHLYLPLDTAKLTATAETAARGR